MLNRAMLCNNANNTVMKKVKGRSGGLLILVVLILAVAMVLITSALMMTVAARDRYYNSALTSQANLTAASVAKTIASAAEIGDLTKADLNQLVILTQTNNLTVTKNKIDGTLSITPGLEGVNDATGNTKTSFTDLKVEYSNIAKTNFKITVNTYLDAGSATNKSQQAVTIYLTENIPVYPEGFGATLNINGASQIPCLTMGYDANGAPSNFVQFSGAVTTNNNVVNFGGDLIITNKIELNGNQAYVAGNLVLIGKNASFKGNSNLPSLSASSYFLDLCDAANPGRTFWSNPPDNGTLILAASHPFSPAGILLKNATLIGTVNNETLRTFTPANKAIYTIGSAQVKKDTTVITGDFKDPWDSSKLIFTVKPYDGSMDSVVTKYTDPTGDAQKSAGFIAPTSRSALMTLLGLDPAYAGMTGQPLIDKLKADQGAVLIDIQSNGKASNAMPLTAPAYYIDTSTAGKLGDPLFINLANNNVDIFIVGNSSVVFTFVSEDGGIRFIRPAGSTHIGRIIFMENGASFDLSNSNGNLSGYAGITGAGMDPNRYSTPGGASIIDGSEPYVYIYGYNNNITANTSHYVEGYYGLFGTGTFTTGGVSNNKFPNIYARFNVGTLSLNSGDNPTIAFCPAPGLGTNSTAAHYNPFVISGYITS